VVLEALHVGARPVLPKEEVMNRWIQRPAHTPLPDSDTTEYRYCLDGLIATIGDMRANCTAAHRLGEGVAGHVLDILADKAEERAADLAHRLFERWIEVVPRVCRCYGGVSHSGPCIKEIP
jgi:hypothetical protein